MSPLEKQRNRQHDIWCLITNIWENRVAIGSSVITRHLIIAKTIGWRSPSKLQICLFSVHQLIIFVASFSGIVHQFIHLSLFDSVLFCSIWFCSIFSVRLFIYLVCHFLFWYWNCIPGISIPSKTTIWQVNKDHTPDCAILCLSIGSESLLPSNTLVGYPEPISPIGLAEGETLKTKRCSSPNYPLFIYSKYSSSQSREIVLFIALIYKFISYLIEYRFHLDLF